MRRIGILGGTFNPFHLGHIFIGLSAAEAFDLDKVLVIPCAVSPFKVGEPNLLSGEERLEMIRETLKDDPLFEPCDIELKRQGISYAVDTVFSLHQRYPEDRLYFIIGMDSLMGLSRWRDAPRLLSLCEMITVSRPNIPLPDPDTLGFPRETAEKLLKNVIQGRLCDISSSEIRRRIAQGRSIRYLVSPAVERRIVEEGLYTDTRSEK